MPAGTESEVQRKEMPSDGAEGTVENHPTEAGTPGEGAFPASRGSGTGTAGLAARMQTWQGPQRAGTSEWY